LPCKVTKLKVSTFLVTVISPYDFLSFFLFVRGYFPNLS
jgi:hypothetical protein